MFKNRALELISRFVAPLMKPMHPDSQTLVALEMNLTSSSLFLSDQLDYDLHFTLSSALFLLLVSLNLWVFDKNQHVLFTHMHTAVRPAFLEFAISRSESAMLQLNLSLSVFLIGRWTCRRRIIQSPPYLLR